SLQPSELAKPVLILFLAFHLESRLDRINEWRTLAPVAATLGLICVLVMAGRDLGTTVALVLIAFAVLFTSGVRLRWLGYAALASLVPLYFFVFHVRYRLERVMA